MPHFLLREIDAVRQLNGHPNIVQLFELYRHREHSSKVYMVFEYMEEGNLREFYRSRY